ncbi:MAG: ankyrin repeat domain-containing protein [Gemmatimonadaceae bacterium]
MRQPRLQSGLRVVGISSIILLLGAASATKEPVVADAAMKGEVSTVRKLIAQHSDVNMAQGDGMTALHWAAERGDTALTTLLLKAHASVKALTRVGNYTPLLIASKTGNPVVIKALIQAGSDVNAITSNGTTPLHFASAAGDPEAVTALIEHGANVNARDSAWGRTPLIFAAEKDRAAAITILLKHGADPAVHSHLEVIQEETAREQAATRARNALLISFEPEKHKTDSADAAKAAAQAAAGGGGGFGGGGRRGGGGPQPKGPFTPDQVQQAIEAGRKVLAQQASAKGPVTEEVDTINGGIAGFANSVGGVVGLTALDPAARDGNIAAAMALLDGGAPINERNLADSTTPLLLAVINGQFDVAMKLVERGADVNLQSTVAMTPLYAAINTQWAPKSRYPQPQAVQNQQTSYLDLMDALLKKGANPNVRLTAQPWYFAFNNCGNANCGLENIEGTTAFWRAAYAVDVDAMKLLVAHGADVNIPSQRIAQPNAAGARAGRAGRGGGGRGGGGRGGGGAPGAAGDSVRAAFAQRGGGRGGPQLPLDPRVDSAAKVAPVGLGVYAIHAAAGVGYGNGFAGNSHRHAPDGWMPAMKYLVEVLHADVNARDQQGMTPLHDAAARGDNEMILYLVAHGADVKAVSRNGRTVVDMANGPVQRLRPFPETIALLEKLGAINQHHCVSC